MPRLRLVDALRRERVVVGHRPRADVRRHGDQAACDPRAVVPSDHRHVVALPQAEALRAWPVEGRDRCKRPRAAEVRKEQIGVVDRPADLGAELELEADVVRPPVPVVVDVERVGDARVEVVVVGAGARLRARVDVGDEHDLVLVARLVAPEHEEVADVRRAVQRNERRLAVTRGRRRLGTGPACRDDRQHEAGHRQRERHGPSPIDSHSLHSRPFS